MRLRIFTFLVMFLATMSGAVWGQTTQTETKYGLKVTGPANSFTFSNGDKLLQIHKDGITITNEKADEAADCKITINCSVYSDPSQPATITLDNVFLKPTTDNATPISIENNRKRRNFSSCEWKFLHDAIRSCSSV